MKKPVFTLCFFVLVLSLNAQSVIVWDPFVMSTLVTCHAAQQKKLKEIKENEVKILAAQTFISEQVRRIKEIEEKLHDRLKTVRSIVRDGANIVYAEQIVEDIGKYQGLMVRYAREDPELVVVAYDAESVLISRTADLLIYIATALTGTDLNLLDNKQRQELIEYVVNELRIMRGIAYSVSNSMKMASKTNVLEFKNPFHLNYPDEDQAILEAILSGL